MILLLATAAFACPSLDAEVDRAATELIAGDFDAALAALSTAEQSFTCAPATTSQVARFWLIEGAALHLRGETAKALAPLAAARAAAPDLFDPRLGPGVRAAWTAATSPGEGTLLIEPQRVAFVDGAGVSDWPVTLAATPHLVQVVGPGGEVRFGRVVRISAGDDAVLDTGVSGEPDPIAIADVTPPEEVKEGKSPLMLIVAGVAAAGAGACAGGALAQHAEMEAATDTATIDAAFDRQMGFGYSTYGLAGLAAAAFTLHFVLP